MQARFPMGHGESLSIYHREKETHIIHEDPDEGYVDIIITHQGVDGSLYHLETIFEEYFPNLQRRSALITLFSFFEHQLDELCMRFAEEGKFAVSLNDLTGKGIGRSSLYIKKVAGLSLNNSTATWQEIKHIQGVRNNIVHNDGKVKDQVTIEYVRCSDFLSGEHEVKIKEGYLPHVIETFDSYFKDINKLITSTNRT
jgi:hypothetical protein